MCSRQIILLRAQQSGDLAKHTLDEILKRCGEEALRGQRSPFSNSLWRTFRAKSSIH